MSYQNNTAARTNRLSNNSIKNGDETIELIPSGDHDDTSVSKAGAFHGSKQNLWMVLVATVGSLLLVAALVVTQQNPTTTTRVTTDHHQHQHQPATTPETIIRIDNDDDTKNNQTLSTKAETTRTGTTTTTTNTFQSTIPMPSGVNFGSWFSLEDYFYVGRTGAVEVATPDATTAGVCLPPLHVGQAGAPTWQAETDLLSSLVDSVGMAHALKIFQAHRASFVTEHDLQRLSQWGVKHVRVPLSWCFTDAHPNEMNMTDTSKEYTEYLEQQFTCRDPFYSNDKDDETVLWPAIPRSRPSVCWSNVS